MKHILLSISFVVISMMQGLAQNLSDIVRMSELTLTGTARSMGVGGSFGAMGGDFSVININPAGLGEYAKGEFVISPSIVRTRSNSNLAGSNDQSLFSKKSTLKIDNLGFVVGRGRKQSSSWGSSNFAFGFNKVADLNRNFEFAGKSVGSITDEFAEKANGKVLDDLDDFRAWPAYRVGAIYDFDEDNNYETDFQEFPNRLVNKSQLVSQEGSINELSFAWAGKYQNKLNLGISVGVPIVSYEETKTYQEDDPDGEISLFDKLQFTEYLNTSGAGINFKTGIIYDMDSKIRVGLALHSPTWYVLNDDYYTGITYAYTDDTGSKSFDHRSPDGSFKYQINSPWRAIGSIGSIYRIGDKIMGFVNADVEWLDYSEGKIDLTEYSSDPFEAQKTLALNQEATQLLGEALNVRLGTELGIDKFRIRIGAESSQSPFNADAKRNLSTSFGIGLREDNFFLDFAVRLSETNQGYLPYTVLDKSKDPLVNVNTDQTKVLITAGFKF